MERYTTKKCFQTRFVIMHKAKSSFLMSLDLPKLIFQILFLKNVTTDVSYDMLSSCQADTLYITIVHLQFPVTSYDIYCRRILKRI